MSMAAAGAGLQQTKEESGGIVWMREDVCESESDEGRVDWWAYCMESLLGGRCINRSTEPFVAYPLCDVTAVSASMKCDAVVPASL